MFKFLSLITKLVISSHDFLQIVAALQTTMSPTVCVCVCVCMCLPTLTENVLSQKICIVITDGTIVWFFSPNRATDNYLAHEKSVELHTFLYSYLEQMIFISCWKYT